MTKEKRIKKSLVNGAISPDFIANSIAKHQSKTSIGAHDIFLGQVRADEIGGRVVRAIEYTAHETLAEGEIHNIRESAFEKFDIHCLHIYHSLGKVKTGEICFFIFTSSAHRKEAFDACQYLVEEIKSKAPIYGKEIYDDKSFKWKENTPLDISEPTK